MGVGHFQMRKYLVYTSEIYDQQESFTMDNDSLNYVRKLFQENLS